MEDHLLRFRVRVRVGIRVRVRVAVRARVRVRVRFKLTQTLTSVENHLAVARANVEEARLGRVRVRGRVIGSESGLDQGLGLGEELA